MKKIKLSLILSFIFCLVAAFGGCSLAVPEGENGGTTPPNVKTEFEDCYVGQMLVIYDKETNEALTSETMGDETCVAYAFKYVAEGFEYASGYVGFVDSDRSGDDYIMGMHNNIEILDGGNRDTAEITLYLNDEGHEDKVYAFDSLMYDENGEVVHDYGVGHTGSFSSFSSKFEITQTITKTVNGNTEEKFLTLCVIMKVEVREVGTDWKILQYSDDGSLIKTDNVSVNDEMDFELLDNCAYIVQEETLSNGEKRRELKQIDHEENYINFYYDGGFGLLTNKPFKLIKPATGE